MWLNVMAKWESADSMCNLIESWKIVNANLVQKGTSILGVFGMKEISGSLSKNQPR